MVRGREEGRSRLGIPILEGVVVSDFVGSSEDSAFSLSELGAQRGVEVRSDMTRLEFCKSRSGCRF